MYSGKNICVVNRDVAIIIEFESIKKIGKIWNQTRLFLGTFALITCYISFSFPNKFPMIVTFI